MAKEEKSEHIDDKKAKEIFKSITTKEALNFELTDEEKAFRNSKAWKRLEQKPKRTGRKATEQHTEKLKSEPFIEKTVDAKMREAQKTEQKPKGHSILGFFLGLILAGFEPGSQALFHS
jgi:hypothetical protein